MGVGQASRPERGLHRTGWADSLPAAPLDPNKEDDCMVDLGVPDWDVDQAAMQAAFHQWEDEYDWSPF